MTIFIVAGIAMYILVAFIFSRIDAKDDGIRCFTWMLLTPIVVGLSIIVYAYVITLLPFI